LPAIPEPQSLANRAGRRATNPARGAAPSRDPFRVEAKGPLRSM
jgi:hypothetical protein